MATSISSLALDIAAKESVIAARAPLAPISLFAHSFADAAGEVGDTVKVPVFARGNAAEFASGTNDYTSASSAGVSGVSISLNKHPWQAQRLLPDDAMETAAGKDWVSQTTVATVEAVAKYMANFVIVDTIMKGASVGSLTIPAAATTSIKKVAAARKTAISAGVTPAQSTLLLSSDIYTDLLSELTADTIGRGEAFENGFCDHLLGFARIAEVDGSYTNTSNKAVTLNAAVVPNDSVGIATRLPLVQNPDLYEVSTLSVPELGPWSFQIRSTGSNAVDAKFLGAEVIFGAALLQASKILLNTTTEA